MKRADFDPTRRDPDSRAPAKAPLYDAASGPPWCGYVNGATLGGPVTGFTYGTDVGGGGSRPRSEGGASAVREPGA